MALFRHIGAGTFPGEIFQFGIHSSGVLGIDDAADLWETSVSAFWSGVEAQIATDTVLTRATSAELDETTGGQITRRDRDLNLPGTNVADSLPFQVTAAVSLRTAEDNRRGRGRFYAPSLAVDAQAGGTLTAAAQTALADSAQAMLQNMAAGGLVPVLLSRDTMVQREVIRIDVGDIMDTQRRRRNALIETRESRVL